MEKTPERIFDAEIHAVVDWTRLYKRMPARYQSRIATWTSPYHGMLNFDQRGGGYRTDFEDIAAASPESIREKLLTPLNIELAVLTATNYDYSIYPDLTFCSARATAYNATLMEDFVEKDDAFFGTLRINFNDPETAVPEIERYADNPRVIAVINTTAGIETPGSRRYDPIYQAIADAGLLLLLHTTAEGRAMCPPPNSAGYPSRYLEYHSALATSTIGHVASLVSNGVFVRHPRLKVLYLEGGVSWALPLMWAMDADWKRLREEVPELTELPSHYIRNHIFLTTQPIEEPPKGSDLQLVYEQIGLDRNIVYSTDFPHWDFDDPKHFLPSCFTPEQRKRILWDNAFAFFGPKAKAWLDRKEAR